MPATNFMSALMLDPRAYLLNPLFCDPSALALLQQQPPFANLAQEQHNGGGKIVGSMANESNNSSSTTTTATNSFRILDILESQARSNRSNSSSGGSEKANTSGENDESMEDESADDPNSSGRSGFGAGSLHSNSKKARKARTIFTDKQLQELETMFEKHKYLSVQDRMDLAHRMGLTDTQVKTWYQNRRTKWKRQAAVGVDLLQEPSNFAVIQNLLRTNPYWMQQYMSNPTMYPFIAQRLLPNIVNQQQSPTSRPQSTNNNCVSNSTLITENPSPATTMSHMNPFPLFFAGLNGFGLQNANITTTSSNSANSSPDPTTPNPQESEKKEDIESKQVVKKSPVNVQQKSP